MKSKNHSVFLDRDGVVNALIYHEEHGRIDTPIAPKDFQLLAGVGESIKALKERGYRVIVVSNQPMVGKGDISMRTFDLTRKKMHSELHSRKMPLLQAVMDVNQKQNELVVEYLENIFPRLEGLSVGLLGLAYKANTSALRSSLALKIVAQLQSKGVKVKAFDPTVDSSSLPRDLVPCSDPYGAAQGSDALIIMTKSSAFTRLDIGRLKALMRKPVVVDACNLFEPEKMSNIGFTYVGIGRGTFASVNRSCEG